jgi:alkylation response protein AidB-like acyl-CoA dehydrogenase
VVLGGLTVLDAGSEAQKSDIIPRVCEGQSLLTLALTEASATYEPWGIEMVATREGDSYVLNGTKLFVPDAHVADVLLVVARTSADADQAKGLTLFLVPSGTGGLSVTQLDTIAQDRQCEVILDGVSVPAASVLGQIGEGWPILQRALERATAGKCAEMLGGAEAVLDMTVEYVKGRTQFGRPVGSFQAVQHHCSQMATDVEGSRNVVYQAAWQVSEGLPAEREVSVAKAWVSGAYQRVCATAHQCHGAIGYTKEHDLQLYTRRAKVQELSYGDTNFHKDLALQHQERQLG